MKKIIVVLFVVVIALMLLAGFVFDKPDSKEVRLIPSISWTNGLAAAVPMLEAAIRLHREDGFGAVLKGKELAEVELPVTDIVAVQVKIIYPLNIQTAAGENITLKRHIVQIDFVKRG